MKKRPPAVRAAAGLEATILSRFGISPKGCERRSTAWGCVDGLTERGDRHDTAPDRVHRQRKLGLSGLGMDRLAWRRHRYPGGALRLRCRAGDTARRVTPQSAARDQVGTHRRDNERLEIHENHKEKEDQEETVDC